MDDVELLVAGGGIAGSSAALVAARAGATTLVLAPDGPMGALSTIEHVEGFPGLVDVSGYELSPMLQDQAFDAGALLERRGANGLARDGARLEVRTDEGVIRATAVIIATGTRPAALGVPGELELFGRGVSHCASCDGPLFSGKSVAVVGGGDSALQETLTLLDHGVKVCIYQLGDALTAQDTYRRRLQASRAVEVRYHARVEAILGSDRVAGLQVLDEATGDRSEDEFDGIFIYVGRVAATEWLAASDVLDAEGRVVVDSSMATSCAGLFAAGDIRIDSSGQAAAAVGDGVTAATSALRYLREARS